MAFHGHHLSHEMSMPSLGADDAAAAAATAAATGGGGTPPAWIRYGEGSFLHLQTTSDSLASPSAAAAAGVHWMGAGDDAVAAMGGIVGADIEADGARCKAEILAHPLYEQLLSAHVACLRVATPVDQLPRIDAQLAQSQGVVTNYSGLAAGDDGREIDQFMDEFLASLSHRHGRVCGS